MLATFYVADVEEAAQGMILQMWCRAFARFPEWALIQAIDEWCAHRRTRPTIADIVQLCLAMIRTVEVELFSLRRLVGPKEQEQARARHAEREAARQREADRVAFLAANPDWTALPGLSAQLSRRERPIEPEPSKRSMREIYEAVQAGLKDWPRIPLPGEPDAAAAAADDAMPRGTGVEHDEALPAAIGDLAATHLKRAAARLQARPKARNPRGRRAHR